MINVRRAIVVSLAAALTLQLSSVASWDLCSS
jgi:hypothetical protein